jgi:hypothetical protein
VGYSLTHPLTHSPTQFFVPWRLSVYYLENAKDFLKLAYILEEEGEVS